MDLHCLRHGHSEYNLLGLCNDDPARKVRLTELGRKQAQRAAEQLRGVLLERIFCSELPRTRETAEIVNRYHRLPVEVRAELNDIRSGCDGRPVAEYFRAIAADRLHTRVGDGETLLEHKERILRFLDWLRRQPEGRVLVVAHEETLRVFAAHARGLGDEQMINLEIENCEVFSFEL